MTLGAGVIHSQLPSAALSRSRAGGTWLWITPPIKAGSLIFEQRHNKRYRYSKLGGKTPLKTLAASNTKLRFPTEVEAPRHRLKKPETGRYHLVRLIRRDLKLNLFGEIFQVPPELQLEYVVATINVKEQKLKLYLDKIQVDEFSYKLR